MVDSPSGVGPRIGPAPAPTTAPRPAAQAGKEQARTEEPDTPGAPPAVSAPRDVGAVVASGETPPRGSLLDILV